MVTAGGETRCRCAARRRSPAPKPATITAVISEKTNGDSQPPVQHTAATPRATSAMTSTRLRTVAQVAHGREVRRTV